MKHSRFNLAKQVSIISYLSEIGYPIDTKGKDKVMIKAFWRGDTNDSVSINITQNIWCDFGTNAGGSIIDLVSVIDGISPIDAVNKLLRGKYGRFSFTALNDEAVKKKTTTINKVCEITHPALIKYLWEVRKIPNTIYLQYLKEVHYTVNGREYFSIGFRNDNGGWVLRNASFKGCTNQHHTYFNNGKGMLAVFEGVFDFLTYLAVNGMYNYDYLILNSTVNISKAVSIFAKYNTVSCYLDNDAAGRTALASIGAHCPDANVTDLSDIYNGYKDLNEWHVNALNQDLV